MQRILALLLLLSCSQVEKKHEDSEQQIQKNEDAFLNKKKKLEEESKNILPNCEGCIIGSSPTKLAEFDTSREIFTLDSAYDRKLENTHFDFPVVDNASTRKWIRYFLGRGKEWFIRSADRAGRYAPVLSQILHENELPRDLIYLAMAESGFQNKVVSHAAAAGPWQFIKSTAKIYGLHVGWYVDERLDPIKASFASSSYLKDLYKRFGSWELAAAGYNAGEGKVGRATRRYRSKDFWRIRKGGYLRRETRDYVPKIMALAIIGKNLRVFGFEEELEAQKALKYEVAHVKKNSDLYLIADDLELSFEELKKWNPELMRWHTPASREHYALKLPLGFADKFSSCCKEKEYFATLFQTYKIKSSGSIPLLSRKFKVPTEILADLNGVNTRKDFRKGELVLLPFREGHSLQDRMYRDLYFKKRRRGGRSRRSFSGHLNNAKENGKSIANPKPYIVKKGDTLWDVARKTGTPLNDLIKTNMKNIKRGSIMPGQELLVQ
jgi:membrane-bound lytic murein transglycosylase D